MIVILWGPISKQEFTSHNDYNSPSFNSHPVTLLHILRRHSKNTHRKTSTKLTLNSLFTPTIEENIILKSFGSVKIQVGPNTKTRRRYSVSCSVSEVNWEQQSLIHKQRIND